jgi:hypothetical protein
LSFRKLRSKPIHKIDSSSATAHAGGNNRTALPTHGGALSNDAGNPRGVHRSVSAASSSKPRRGSSGEENNNAVSCESTSF